MTRKMLLAAAVCVALTGGFVSNALAAGKIGVANLMAVTAQSQPGQEAEKQLQSMFGAERTQLEKQAADLNKKAEDLQKQAAALSEKARNDRAAEIQNQARDLDTKGAAFSTRLNGVQQAITTQLQDIVGTACANYAKKNGFDIIMDGAAVMFATESTNVADGLIAEINSVWKSKGGKFNLSAPKK